MWKKEVIPDEDFLYCRIHNQFVNRKVTPFLPKESAFTNTPKEGDNLSTDWDKYTTAEDCRNLVAKQKKVGKDEFKNPNDFCIYKFNVNNIRLIETPKQIVEHDPIFNEPEAVGTPNNRSHAIIIGDKSDPELRLKLADLGEWAISPI